MAICTNRHRANRSQLCKMTARPGESVPLKGLTLANKILCFILIDNILYFQTVCLRGTIEIKDCIITNIDIVVITHDHYDHLDYKTIKLIDIISMKKKRL